LFNYSQIYGVIASVEITSKDYKVWYDGENATVFLKGFLRLDGIEEYKPIMNLLTDAIGQVASLTIDLKELEFLNSSGISMLSMFVVEVRNRGSIEITLQGSNKVLWQTKSLRNLQRLMPNMKLEFI
jgi:hypothetical protein